MTNEDKIKDLERKIKQREDAILKLAGAIRSMTLSMEEISKFPGCPKEVAFAILKIINGAQVRLK